MRWTGPAAFALLALACEGGNDRADAETSDAGADAGASDAGEDRDAGRDAAVCAVEWRRPAAVTGCDPVTLTERGEAEATETLGTGTTVHRNVTYAVRGGFALQGDLYLPPADPRGLPGLLVVVHGGGWSGCNLRRGNGTVYAQAYTDVNRFASFNVEYRLVTEGGGYPEDLGDLLCAVQWAAENERGFAYDPTRIAIAGESAGGHLAVMVAMSADRGDLDPHCGRSPPRVQLAVSYSGVFDLPTWTRHGMAEHDATELFAGPCDTPVRDCARGRDCDRCVDASPLAHACEATPRIILVHAPDPYDTLVPLSQATDFDAALRAAGRPVDLVVPTPEEMESFGCPPGSFVHAFTPCLAGPAGPVVGPAYDAILGVRP